VIGSVSKIECLWIHRVTYESNGTNSNGTNSNGTNLYIPWDCFCAVDLDLFVFFSELVALPLESVALDTFEAVHNKRRIE